MAGGIDWFRWHHGSVTDPKFQLVARRSGASLPDVLAVWAYILELASASQDRGSFGDVDAEAIDCLFNFPEDQGRTAAILQAMEDRGLTEAGRVTAWAKRQPKREDDSAADRKRAQRQREAEAVVTQRDESACHAVSRDVTLEESREKENSSSLRSEEEAPSRSAVAALPTTPVPDFLGDENESRIPTRAVVKLGTAWELPEAWGLDAEKLGWQPDSIVKEAEKFRQHWVSGKGAGTRRSLRGWRQAWSNWLSNAEKFRRAA